MIRALWILALLVAGSPQDVPEDWVEVSATPDDGALSIQRAGSAPALVIRSDEELTYLVEIDFGPFRGVDVGEATDAGDTGEGGGE